MKKNHFLFNGGRGTPPRKSLRVIRLSLFMFLLIFWQLSASAYSQKTRLNLNLQDVSVKEVFQIIKSQSEFTFVFNEEDIAQLAPVTLNVDNETVEEILQQCMKGSELTWKLVDNVIVINSPDKKEFTQPKPPTLKTIKGKVSDQQGGPIPGVNVVVQGYKLGTVTNADGNYEIEIPEGATKIAFTFIGFKMQVIDITGKTKIDVKMATDVSEIEDVVVVGYFNQTKESFTGSVVTISAEELLQAGNQNILQSIQLVDPSFMQVENTSMGSNPNAMPEFQIRGSASVNMQGAYEGNPNAPTFILDGFEVDLEKIYDLDPYRVRSITILKDAAATAIYGSRAANGVVVVETMAPKGGKMAINYKGDFTFAGADLSDFNLLNAEEKLALELAAGLYESSGLVSGIEKNQERYNEKLKMVQQGYNTYWLNKPLEKLALSHKHSLLLEGGVDEIRYGIDLNFNDKNGIMKESGRDRLGIGLKLQYAYKNIIIRNKLTYDYVKGTNSPYGSFTTYAKMNPYYRYKDDQGNYLYLLEDISYSSIVLNPLYNTTLNIIDEDSSDNLINNFDIDWRINSDWRLKGSMSINKKISGSDLFLPGKHTSFASTTEVDRKGSYSASRAESLRWETNIVLNYFKQVDKHVLNGNAIFSADQSLNKSFSIKAEGFPNEDMDNINFAIQYEKDKKPTGSEYTSRKMGITGNVNYSYDDRLLADLSYRMDGSSSFGADKRWAPFWAVGTGWNIHKESFMKKFSFINRLKIRGSYGSTGSVAFNPYQAMRTYKYLTDQMHRFETGAVLMGLGNDKLTWQQTIKRNIGLDFMLFNKRLSGTFNYYNDLSKDMLVDIDLAPSLGFSQYKENLGESQNQGYEVVLRYEVLRNKRGFNWSVYGNLAHNKNTLLKLSDSLDEFNSNQDAAVSTETKPRVRYIEGQSMTSIWANKSLGIDPATGKEIFVTKNGGTTLEWSSDNFMVCGDSNPDFLGSFGSNFSYKGFYLNTIFKYRYGGQSYNQTLVDRVENANPIYNVDRRMLDARWEKPGDVTFYKDVKDKDKTRPTSRFIQDYNFLELASINASYEFNTEFANKIGMKRLKMTLYLSDIFRTSSLTAERGLDYPFERSFSVGIQGRF